MTKRSQRRKMELYGYDSDGFALKSVTIPAATMTPFHGRPRQSRACSKRSAIPASGPGRLPGSPINGRSTVRLFLAQAEPATRL